MRADAMLEAGDLGGLAVWKRILRAVEWPGRTLTLFRDVAVLIAARSYSDCLVRTLIGKSHALKLESDPTLKMLPVWYL